MTSSQAATTEAGTVAAARAAPNGRPAALPGTLFPLGATTGEHLGLAGTNFALVSSVATSVTLCLFDKTGTETGTRPQAAPVPPGPDWPGRSRPGTASRALLMTHLGAAVTERTSPGKEDLGSRPAGVITKCGYGRGQGSPARHRASTGHRTRLALVAGHRGDHCRRRPACGHARELPGY
jgi:hypothetical protein